jgi:regulatory protein
MAGGGAAAVRALELAYRYLNRRERTVHEVRQHLIADDLDAAAVDAAVEELIEDGHLDDVRYARMFTEDKRSLEQWGRERIRRALLARGIERGVVEEALAVESGDDKQASGELDRAIALLRQRVPDPPRDRRQRQRALGLLLRRGYEPELAVDALNAYARQRE